MQEHELPAWLLRTNHEVDVMTNQDFVDLENFGSGKREKKEVSYDDNLTEKQFLNVRPFSFFNRPMILLNISGCRERPAERGD